MTGEIEWGERPFQRAGMSEEKRKNEQQMSAKLYEKRAKT